MPVQDLEEIKMLMAPGQESSVSHPRLEYVESTFSRRQEGVALLISVMMLTIMGLIGLGSMELATRDRQVAGYMASGRSALYAADAGVALGQSIIDQDVGELVPQGVSALFGFAPTFPTEASPQILGDGSSSQPRFMQNPDPDIGQAVDYIGMGEACDGWIMSDEFGGSQWREALFSIDVEGRTPSAVGSSKRVEASAAYCYPYQ
ncbi:MAG: pilus assembly PilX N-terminal domain-containing protein [Myxococcota bacterium]|nr:pilus assembly PilX N-terminal domain-containing protein [Myxococcota bacterium]